MANDIKCCKISSINAVRYMESLQIYMLKQL